MNESLVTLEDELPLIGYISAKKAETLQRRCAEYRKEIKRLNKLREMKRWTNDCKPRTPGMYWLRDFEGNIYINYVSSYAIRYYGHEIITHWLDVGSKPILPGGRQ